MTDQDAELLAWLARTYEEYRRAPAAMAQLVERGHRADVVAAAAGVHKSTVWRAVARARARRR